MSHNNFPTNPTDGLIVEISGKFWQFSKAQNTWIELQGYGDFVRLATPVKNGLMSKEDYQKIFGLLLPPPATTISSEDCDVAFDKGTIGIRSDNEDLIIQYELPLVGKNEFGSIVEENEIFQIHENTYGISFRLNLEKLVKELTERGQLTYRKRTGPQGSKGPKGEPGVDRLDTGPQGEDGESGANVPFNGSLTTDKAAIVLAEPGKGIIDITTERISSEENYLVLTRANIGNPDYCPEFIKPQNIPSKWVLVVDESEQVRRDCNVEICGKDVCGSQSVALCGTKLFYLDVSDILADIRTRFDELLVDLKASKEELARAWLRTMMDIYHEQKLALCCAVENAESRKEMDRNRERIEELRIQAAQANKQLVIGGGLDKNIVKSNQGKTCEFPAAPPPPLFDPAEDDICPIIAEIALDCQINNSEPGAISLNLDAGAYIAILENCCCFDQEGFAGRFAVEYNTGAGPKISTSIDQGGFQDQNDAIRNYLGASISFNHTGGTTKFWMSISGSSGSGKTRLVLKSKDCVATQEECISAPNFGEVGTGFLGSVGTEVDGILSDEIFQCNMPASQVDWYEVGWRTGACCGAYVQVGSTKWIVVKRSLGIDTTCGGGESAQTDCIAQGLERGVHPAIAFQSEDGIEFLGKPANNSSQALIRDIDLETEIMAKIRNGEILDSKGDPLNNFEAILFPLNV